MFTICLLFSVGLWWYLLLQHSSKMFPISATLTFATLTIPPVVSSFLRLIQFTSDHRLYQLDPFTSKAAQIQIVLPCALVFALCVSYSDYDNTRKMTIFIFLLRWHNRNITKIYYNSFLIQILFLMSCVTLGKQWGICLSTLYNLFNMQILVLNSGHIKSKSL